MTELLEQALDAVRRLPAAEQDHIAHAIMRLAGGGDIAPVPLTDDEQAAVRRSQEAAARGEFATDDEIAAVWAKHGL